MQKKWKLLDIPAIILLAALVGYVPVSHGWMVLALGVLVMGGILFFVRKFVPSVYGWVVLVLVLGTIATFVATNQRLNFVASLLTKEMDDKLADRALNGAQAIEAKQQIVLSKRTSDKMFGEEVKKKTAAITDSGFSAKERGLRILEVSREYGEYCDISDSIGKNMTRKPKIADSSLAIQREVAPVIHDGPVVSVPNGDSLFVRLDGGWYRLVLDTAWSGWIILPNAGFSEFHPEGGIYQAIAPGWRSPRFDSPGITVNWVGEDGFLPPRFRFRAVEGKIVVDIRATSQKSYVARM